MAKHPRRKHARTLMPFSTHGPIIFLDVTCLRNQGIYLFFWAFSNRCLVHCYSVASGTRGRRLFRLSRTAKSPCSSRMDSCISLATGTYRVTIASPPAGVVGCEMAALMCAHLALCRQYSSADLNHGRWNDGSPWATLYFLAPRLQDS
jgi:hypothetical protein